MNEEEAEQFAHRFEAAWASREPGVKASLWHPDGTLRHPVLDAPIDGATVPTNDDNTKALIPDLEWRLRNWASRGNVVFLEFRWTGTVNGIRVELEGADRMILRGGKITEEVVFVDTYPLRRALDPSLPDEPIVRVEDLADGS